MPPAVSGWDDQAGYTQYVVVCGAAESRHRFSSFLALHKQIIGALEVKGLPRRFPARKHLLHPDRVKGERCVLLQQYLNDVIDAGGEADAHRE